jgi:hypothetical protein
VVPKFNIAEIGGRFCAVRKSGFLPFCDLSARLVEVRLVEHSGQDLLTLMFLATNFSKPAFNCASCHFPAHPLGFGKFQSSGSNWPIEQSRELISDCP